MTAATGGPPLVLTMGEPAGIAGEITLKAWQTCRETGPVFAVIADPDQLVREAAALGLAVPIATVEAPGAATGQFGHALPVLAQPLAAAPAPGRPVAENGAGVLGAIERATELCAAGAAAAMVTNPIHKETLYQAGFRHPGHTEYLGALAGLSQAPVMMLAAAALRVVPVTIHLPLGDAVRALTTEAIVHCGRLTAAALKTDFGIAEPRLAVAGLNPHAGEGGHLGREEIDVIAPAVVALRAEGLAVRGPLPADSLFHARARARYDAALCMYHDQALIPLKTLDFEGGVNITLGLPFVRTSPDHGTGFDIAGRGVAGPANLVAAIRLAAELADRRRGAAARRATA